MLFGGTLIRSCLAEDEDADVAEEFATSVVATAAAVKPLVLQIELLLTKPDMSATTAVLLASPAAAAAVLVEDDKDDDDPGKEDARVMSLLPTGDGGGWVPPAS